ncbi:MAG: response regulator [Myxococcales bacterium]
MAKRILVIDSDESFANVLAGAIAKSGHTPLTATNSDQGLTLAKQENPDLIVVCVEAQPTNGYMLCTRLKKDDKLKSIPVVLTSANATPESFEKHKKLKTRAEEYLIKPFQPAALLTKASALLGIAPPSEGDAQKLSEDDESLGLTNLTADDDEPIHLTDDDVHDGGHLEEGVLVDDVEEVVHLDETGTEGDQDLEMFDQAFENLKPIEPAPLERPHLRLAPEPAQDAAFGDDEPLLAPTVVSAPTDDQILAGLTDDEDLRVAAPEDDETLLEDPELQAAPVAVIDELQAAPETVPETVIDELQAPPDAIVEEPHRMRHPVAAAPEHVEPEMGDLLETPLAEDDEPVTGPARSDLQARIAELEMALADRTAEVEAARQSSPSAELQRLKEARNRQEKEILRLREELHEKDKQLLTLEEQQTALEAQAQELRDETKKRESASKALQQRADALAAAAKKLERDLATAREELKSNAGAKAKAAEADKLRTQLTEAKSRCETLETEMTGVRELHESEVSALKADLEKARGELEAARTEIEAARAEAAEAVASSGQNEERAVKAYQKIKNDEKLREKTRKALEIALALLQDNSVEPAEEREPEKRSA